MLYDITGNLLKQVYLENPSSNYDLYVGDVKDGLYLLKVVQKDDESYGKLIIKR